MKNPFLRRNDLYGIILALAMLAVSPSVQGAPPGNASELAGKYGLTQQQLLLYGNHEKERDKAMKVLNNNPNLSSKERKKHVKVILHDFEQKVSSVMSKDQYEKWLADRRAFQQQETMIKKEFEAKMTQINRSDLPYRQQREQVAAAEAEYVRQMAILCGSQKDAERRLEKWHTLHKMAKENKRNVKMSFDQTRQLQSLTDEKNRKIAELNARQLPKKLRESESDRIKTEHNASVRKLLGDRQYAEWEKSRNMAIDRELKRRYGMTPAQIAKYKELQNARAVERYKVSHSKLPKTEQKAKRSEIDVKHETRLKELLSADQYRKMAKDKVYKEEKKAFKESKSTQITQNK